MGLSRTRALSRIRRSKLGENDSFNYIPLRWGIIWLTHVDQWYFSLVYMAPLLYLVNLHQVFFRFNSVCIISHGTFVLRWISGKYKLGTVHKVDVVIFDIHPLIRNLMSLTSENFNTLDMMYKYFGWPANHCYHRPGPLGPHALDWSDPSSDPQIAFVDISIHEFTVSILCNYYLCNSITWNVEIQVKSTCIDLKYS